MIKELYFKRNKKTDGTSKKEKILMLIWRFIDFWMFQPSLTIFSTYRVFLLKLFGAKIGKGCYIGPKVKIYKPWKIIIGNYTSIDDHVTLLSSNKIIIGDYVSIAKFALIIGGGHDIRSRYFENNALPIYIGNGAFIGAASFVGRGVTIGQFSVLGARSLTFKDIPENSIAIGSPAKVKSERIPKEEYQKYRYNYLKE